MAPRQARSTPPHHTSLSESAAVDHFLGKHDDNLNMVAPGHDADPAAHNVTLVLVAYYSIVRSLPGHTDSKSLIVILVSS
jgi:hypothetical protein